MTACGPLAAVLSSDGDYLATTSTSIVRPLEAAAKAKVATLTPRVP